MKTKILEGQVFLDSDGDEVEVVKIGKRSIVLKNSDDELLVAGIEDVLQDIASGDLVDSEYFD